MSIIADTLNRLQNPSRKITPEMVEEPSLRPTFDQGEGARRHLQHSGMKFWMIGIGIIIGLVGLALSTFWIGGHLDFGLSTNTHALITDSSPMPPFPLQSDVQSTTPATSELIVATTSEPQIHREHTSPASKLPINRPPTQNRSPAPTPMKSQLVVAPPEPTVLGGSFHQQAQSTSEQSTDKDSSQIALSESSSKVPPALEELLHQPTPEVESQHIVESDIEEPQTNHLGTVTSEAELIHKEEVITTAKLSTNPIHSPSSFTVLKGRQEAMNRAGQTTIPLQPSPANRLHHAQQLVQTGNYEEAVSLLSPLFHDPPIKWQPWFWMGTALLGKGDMEEADQFFLSGLARNDKVPQLWVQRALVAQQRGDYQLAIHELRQAESLDADLPHIHLNLGYAYERLGNDRLANQYYGKFLKLSEGQPAFFSTRKKLYARLTQPTPAVQPSSSSVPKP